jgi:asparagine synthase (glutamine-hydrolysing)
LKYATVPGGLLFASELKSILASGLVEPAVDLEDVSRYLGLGFVPGPGTGFRGIRKLPPAHRLVWEDGKTRIERYWSLDFARKRKRSAEEWREEVRDTVERAVTKRLVSDVPLGAFLSGGVDSSIVVACMSKALSRPVETFSAGFEFDEYSELPYARAVADRFGTAHHEFQVESDAATLLPVLARLYEEPFADCSALPSYLLAREARRHVTVVLNGDGGDEGFVGYTRYARLADWNARLDAAGRLGVPRIAGATAG